jgi:hypothetical protein
MDVLVRRGYDPGKTAQPNRETAVAVWQATRGPLFGIV